MGNDLHMLQLLSSIFSKSCLIDAMVNWRLKVSGFHNPFVSSLCSHVMFVPMITRSGVWTSGGRWSVSGSAVADLVLWFQFWIFCRLKRDPELNA
jgi:hypothetical protein